MTAPCHRIVVKVGTSTLTYENGALNLRAADRICKVLSDLMNAGRQVLFVTSGAIGVGAGRLGLAERPRETRDRQAAAAVGQCELMRLYEHLFGEYNRTVAQILLTRDVMENELTRRNVVNTLHTLLELRVLPIVNENDTVAVEELEGHNFGDNDMLSAIVAEVAGADLLILLTDTDGLYDADPQADPAARRIPEVAVIDEAVMALAGGSGSNRGTGGMRTKLLAAARATERGIPAAILHGARPEEIYDLLEGKPVGTVFRAGEKQGENT